MLFFPEALVIEWSYPSPYVTSLYRPFLATAGDRLPTITLLQPQFLDHIQLLSLILPLPPNATIPTTILQIFLQPPAYAPNNITLLLFLSRSNYHPSTIPITTLTLHYVYFLLVLRQSPTLYHRSSVCERVSLVRTSSLRLQLSIHCYVTRLVSYTLKVTVLLMSRSLPLEFFSYLLGER